MMRREIFLECVLLAVLLAFGAVLERRQGGLTLVYLGLAALFAGPAFRRLLVFQGRARPAPRWTLSLELAAFTGLIVWPIGLWSHAMLAAAALSFAITPPESLDPGARATLLEEVGVALVALAGAAVAAVVNGASAVPGLALLVPLALEAWSPGASRTVASAARRAAAFGIAGAAAIMLGADWRPGARADESVFGVALVLAFVAGLDVLARMLCGNPTGRLDDLLGAAVAFGGRRGAPLGYATGLALLGVALLGTGTLRIPAMHALTAGEVLPEAGLAFLAPGVSASPDGNGEESTLEVREDGRPLGSSHAYIDDIREQGHGRFRHDPRRVTFSSSDGTDPRANGRAYTLAYDWLPGPALLALLLLAAVLLNGGRAARAAAAIERAPPPIIAAAVLAVALAFRIQLAIRGSELTLGHLVKGVPFSDARDWYAVAVDFSRNERNAAMWYWCDARRPFHYASLGAIFALVGPSILAARVFNIVLSSLTSVAIFDATRRIAIRPVALVAALAHALLLYDARQDMSVMTEPLGNFLAALAVWAFVLGATLLGRDHATGLRRAIPVFLGGGVALGLSNLARPLTLLAVGGLPLALALVAGRVGVPWRRVAWGTAAFGAGTALSVVPWLVRQKLVYGIWTLSENTAEAWFGATSPDYGTWSSTVGGLAGSRNVTERVAFYMEGASRNLHEHLGWYVRHVIEQLGITLRFTGLPAWAIVVSCAWYVAVALASPERAGERRGLAVLAALVMVALVLAPEPPLYIAMLGGLGLSIARRRPIALLAGLFVPTLVSVAMIAMAFERRLTHSVEWISAAFASAVVFETLAWVEGVDPRREPRIGDDGTWGRTGRALGVVAGLTVVLAVVGFARILATPRPPRRTAIVSAEPWVSRALDAGTRERLGPLASRLVARRARLRPGFAISLAAGERIVHWSPMFEPRTYAFTVFETEPELPETYAVWPGAPPEGTAGRELIVVGVPTPRPLCGGTLEVLAMGVLEGEEPPRAWLCPDGPTARDHIATVASASR